MKFAINFIISFLGYLVINFIGYLIRSAFYPEMGINNFIPTGTPSWVLATIFFVGLLLNIGITSILYYILGSRLNILNSNFVNYLSVCGSFVFIIVLIVVQLTYKNNNQLLFDANASLGIVWNIVVNAFRKNDISYYIMASIPSIITWFGILHQSKKI